MSTDSTPPPPVQDPTMVLPSNSKRDQSILETIISIVGPEAINGLDDSKRKEASLQLEGRLAYLIFLGQLRFLKIKEIGEKSPESATRNGQNSCLNERMKEKHGIFLKYPKANMVVGQEKIGGKLKFYPTELVFLPVNPNFVILESKTKPSPATAPTPEVLHESREDTPDNFPELLQTFPIDQI